jgi:histidinol phosphatase-like PHP family hydrolase
VHGELHCHTDATSDQVEFGAPVEAMVELAKAQGLNFFAATDHSYDLDDLPENYLKNDSSLRKWHDLRERIKQCNVQNQDFVIIPGEEVSAGNSRRRNVHFLIFNSFRFFPGSGDSAERWFRTEPEMSITEILDQLGDEALAFAAHPEVPAPFLEWLLLRRGKWQWPDYQHPRLNGLQIWNGALEGMEEGLARWRELLLAGKNLFIIAGDDAHGNFNRFRQVGIPHLRMREHHWHLFGRTRTAVLVDDQVSLSSLMAALRKGRACITTGPLVDLQIVCENGRSVRLGETVMEPIRSLAVQAKSSPEFGKLQRVVVWLGDLQEQNERILFETNNFVEPFLCSHTPSLNLPAGQFYLRGEAHSAGSEFLPEQRLPCRGLTNPIWVEVKK